MTFRRIVSCALLVIGSVVPSALTAQVVSTASGTPAFGTFGGGPDVINLADLNVHWSIPLVHKAGRGLNFDYTLSYDSSIWVQLQGDDGPSTNYWSAGPIWQGSGPGGTGSVLTYSAEYENNCQYNGTEAGVEYTNFVYIDSAGNSHPFMPDPTPQGDGAVAQYVYTTDDCSSYTAHGFPAYATDGSGIQLRCDNCAQKNPAFANVPSPLLYTIVLPSGVIIPTSTLTGLPTIPETIGPNPPLYVYEAAVDSNGNYISYTQTSCSYGGDGSFYNILGSYNLGYPYTNCNDSVAFTDTTGAAVMSATLQNTQVNTTASTVTVTSTSGNYVITTGALSLGLPAGQGLYEQANLVSNIQLPDGRAYGFTYVPASSGNGAVTPLIQTVTLPSGGSITYQDGSTYDLTDNTPMSLIRTVNDGRGNTSKWTYVRSWSAANQLWETLVTDPAQNQTDYFFTGSPPPPPNQDLNVLYSSPQSGSYYEVARTVYSGLKSAGVVLMSTTTAYTGNLSAATGIGSKQVFVSPNGGPRTSSTLVKYNDYGLPSETDVYDYGTVAGTPGPLLAKTLTTYAADGDLLNRPASVTSYDGKGNVLSSTTYGYDQTAVTATSGTPNQLAPASARGNLTSVSNGQTGATMTYLDTGQVNQSFSSSGTTTMSYTCGGAYPSGTSTFVSTSMTYTTSTSWNCWSGLPTSKTDINGNKTSILGYDPYGRPTSIADPLGNVTTMTYPTSTSNTSEVSETFNGGQSISDVLTTYDGLGRAILSQTRQAPGGTSFTSVSQTFDPRGYPYWTSLPYVAAAGVYTPTGTGSATTVYDALGRIQSSQDADGGTMSYSYNENDTLITAGPAPTGETTKSRQLEVNGAGQLTSVCEITTGTGAGACGQSTPATGYFTQYTYDGGNLTQIAQNVQAGTAATQLHTFSYDTYGHKLTERDPETGLTSYGYNSYGQLATVTDNIGNVTSYTYDTIGRPLSAIVAGPYSVNTPATYFVYDAATLGTTKMQNALGSLAEEYTCTNPCSATSPVKLTDIYYSAFAQSGQTVSQMWESTPHSNGNYTLTQTSAYPNGTMSSLSASLNGAPIGIPTISYGVDSLGRPITVTDTTHSLNLVTATNYNIVGGATGVTYGNTDYDTAGFDPNTFRQTSFGSKIGSPANLTVSGTLNWNPNGSLGSFQFTDSADSTKNQNCTYGMDPLNRLASVNCNAWAQNFAYDAFGNIQKSGPANPQPGQTTQPYVVTYSEQTNQVTTTPAQYDGDGNQMSSTTGLQMSWDANAHPVVVHGVGAVYDAAGRLVETGDAVNAVAAAQSTGLITLSGYGEPLVPAKTQYTATGKVNLTSYLSSGFNQEKGIASPSGSDTAGCGAIVGVPSNAPTSWDCYDTGGGAVTIVGINSSGGQVFQQTFGLGYGGPGDDVASLAAELQADIDQVQTPSYSLSATVTQTIASAAQLTISATQLASASPIVAFVITSSGLSCSGNNGNFSPCSFALTAPGGGPPSVVQIPAVTDTGTISVAINGGATASYTWKPTDTWSAVQSGLIAAINLQYGGSLTASASSYGVQLTSKQPGYGTNWPVAVSYTSSNPLGTSPAESSYSPTATNMAGGVTAGPGASAGSSYTTVVYTPGGSKLATYTNGVAASTLQAAEIPLPGGGTAMYNASGLNYLRHSDWLGSSRLATTWGHTVYAKTAYAPFGETYNTSGTDASFTGEDVDPSSGYFNFLYRKFDPVAGRWTSPDPSGLASADFRNPQTFNLYSYVLNNPMTLVDPTGLDCVYYADDGSISNIQAGDCTSDDDDGQYINGTITNYFYDSNTSSWDFQVTLGTPIFDADSNSWQYSFWAFSPTISYNPTWNGADASVNVTGSDGQVQSVPSGQQPPSNAAPWYQSCTVQALLGGAQSIAVDSIGFIPLGNDIEIGAETAARQLGNLKGYRGIVADNYGRALLTKAGIAVKGTAAGVSFGEGFASGDYVASTLNTIGLIPIPGLSDVTSALSIAYDAGKTAVAVYKCSHP